jgi:hypothetical protein
MTYLWTGTYLRKPNEARPGDSHEGPDRSGFAQMNLSTKDGGSGRVDHVAEKVTLVVDIQRVTSAIVAAWRPEAKPDLLRNPAERDSFAAYYAERRARSYLGERA